MNLLVVCEGDAETFAPCNDEHPGGTYQILPEEPILNSILKVKGNQVIARGQNWQAHCAATAGTKSSPHPILHVNGTPVCLSGDQSTSGCHTSNGFVTTQVIFKAKA